MPISLIPSTGQTLGWSGVAVLAWLLGSLVAASLWSLAFVVATPLVMVMIATYMNRRSPTLRRTLLWAGIVLWLYCLLAWFRFMFPPILAWKIVTQTSLCLLLLVAAATLKGRSEVEAR